MTANQADEAEQARPLGRLQKVLIGVILMGVVGIAAIGFAGSYHSVTALARAKGFGWFSNWFTVGVDAGIGVLLGLDLLLTWLRMPFPLLRPSAWFLTGATIVFNAAAAWPDYLGSGMHGVIPVLFVISVEAARHAIGRIANIAVDRHIESPPLSRWLVDPVGAFRIWRRQRRYNIRSYDEVIDQRRQVRVYIAQLRNEHGRRWRRIAPADKLLILKLAAEGMTVEDAIALPEKEAERQRQAEFEREEEARAAEADRQEEARLAEEKRLAAEAERRRREREEQEAADLAAIEMRRREEELRRAQDVAVEERRRRGDQEERERRLADAQLDAQLAEIERAKREADDLLAAEAWEREQERKRQEQETAERIAAAAKVRADALTREREEAGRLRQLAAQGAMAATVEAPRVAPRTAATERHESATQSASVAPRVEERERPRGATHPATKAPVKAPSKRPGKDPRGAAKDAIKGLYDTLGRRPLESEMVAALKQIRSPHGSRQFANKLRAEIETEHPELAALGSDNVRPLTGS